MSCVVWFDDDTALTANSMKVCYNICLMNSIFMLATEFRDPDRRRYKAAKCLQLSTLANVSHAQVGWRQLIAPVRT